MSEEIQYYSYEENVKEARKEMQEFESVIMPLLKEKKVFSFSDVETIASLFYYAGASVNILGQYVKDRWEDRAKREEAKQLREEYSAVCRKALNVIKDGKSQEAEVEKE